MRSSDGVSTDPALRSCLVSVAEAETLLADVRRRLARLCISACEEHLLAPPRPRRFSQTREHQVSGFHTTEAQCNNSNIVEPINGTRRPSLGTENDERCRPRTSIKIITSDAPEPTDREKRLTSNVLQAFQTAKEDHQYDPRSCTADHVVIDPGHQRGLLPCVGIGDASECAPDFVFTQSYFCRCVPMVHPEATVRLTWVIIGFFFILYECYSLPFYLAFDEQPSGFFFIVASLINVYFICDVPFSFRTGCMTNEGQADMNPCSVASRYTRTWLILDVIASIPWEWFSDSKSWVSLTRGSKGFRIMRISRALRLVRILRLFKLKVMLDTIDCFIEANPVLVFAASLARISFWMSVLSHWGACIWYAIGAQDKDETTWVKYYLTAQGYNSVFQHYVWSLYFTLTTLTTVGYGDVTPTNFDECCFALVLLLAASVLFAGLLGVLTELFRSVNRHNRSRMERKNTLSRYMRWRKLDRKLKARIRAYLLFLWDTKETHDAHEKDIMNDLTPVLRSDLCYHIFRKPLTLAPFLSWMKDYPICVKCLACNISCTFLDAGDYLFRIGDPSDRVFMLLSGRVWLTRNEKLSDDNSLIQDVDKSSKVSAKGFQQQGMKKDDRSASDGTFINRRSLRLPRHNTTMFVQAQRIVKKPFLSGIGFARTAIQDESSAPPEAVKNKLRKTKLVPTTQHDDFDSELLRNAYDKVHTIDQDLDKAALKVQRKWRALMETRREYSIQRNSFSMHTGVTQTTINQRIAHMPSRTVEAPAYFGESCLWLPLQEWGTEEPEPRTYLAKCLDRNETLCIRRAAVKKVLDQFSPWLPDRFENFRQAVIEGMENIDASSSDAHAHKSRLRMQASFGTGSLVSASLLDVVDAVSPCLTPRHRRKQDGDESESQVAYDSHHSSKAFARAPVPPGLIE